MNNINKKTKQINILLSQKEYINLLSKCEAKHLKVSTYVRQLVLMEMGKKMDNINKIIIGSKTLQEDNLLKIDENKNNTIKLIEKLKISLKLEELNKNLKSNKFKTYEFIKEIKSKKYKILLFKRENINFTINLSNYLIFNWLKDNKYQIFKFDKNNLSKFKKDYIKKREIFIYSGIELKEDF